MKHHELSDGSITTPAGFSAAGIATGLKHSGAPDLALLVSDAPAEAAGAFTTNQFAAAPVIYDRAQLAAGTPVRAIVVNSGNANACTGSQGLADVRKTAEHAAHVLGIPPGSVLISSTGRIGIPLPLPTLLNGIEKAAAALSPEGGEAAAQAIMTTDTRPKSLAVHLEVDGQTITIGGMAKGAGMIAPRLRTAPPSATMLAYLTTDAATDRTFLHDCLKLALDSSFNRITVDGDTSTNDTVIALANGRKQNQRLDADHPAAGAFQQAFTHVMSRLAREIVLDAEGITRFVELCVAGAATDAEARHCAETIATSPLCKTAWFGGDPNWGRILAAAGRAGVAVNADAVTLDYQGVPIVRDGMDAGTPENEQSRAIDRRELRIDLNLGVGKGTFTVWTCDLSYEYVKINAEYHT
ncbi:MAG: bifunctional glutamate N-acetyltransferase/amino-acid acetyltransferase ArgJ [Candidatus Pacebacteria bacterium]|nr:bifunctional glutamate N-acetyltransferase/amino-acid acetyltransferase ArgJ [Candidatus Paceibacterota bacterium]